MERITIIGLGLIGGSVGLGLKRAGLKNVEIVGHDASSETAAEAGRRKAIDRVEWNIHSAVKGASLVIIATPVLAIRETLELIREDVDASTVVTDVGSTKREVLAWAEELLPAEVSFVGGHPMAGREVPGIGSADAELFRGATWCVTPSPTAVQPAIETVWGLATSLGAEPWFVDAEEHDGFVAGVSHLPMALAATLVQEVLGSPAWRELSRVAAGGFRDTSRLAAQSPVMTRDIMLSNRENVLRWLDRYQERLAGLRELLDAGDGEALLAWFGTAQDQRARWTVYKETGRLQDDTVTEEEFPTSGETVRDMMLGRGLSSRINKLLDLTRNQGQKPPGQPGSSSRP